jgi:hypothetical protein
MPPLQEKCPHCAAPLLADSPARVERKTCPSCGRPLHGAAAARRFSLAALNNNPRVMAATAAIALGALAITVFSVMWSQRQEVSRRAQGAPAQLEQQPAGSAVAGDGKAAGSAAVPGPGPVAGSGSGSEPAATQLIIARGGRLAGGQSALVALRRPVAGPLARPEPQSREGLLARELVHQAVLIAARDELGLATRDEVLGESSPLAPDGGERIEIGAAFLAGALSRAVIRRRSGASVETLMSQSLGTIIAARNTGQPAPDDLPKLVETTEAMSRRVLPAVLRTLGLAGKANALSPEAPLPDGAEQGLSRKLGFCEPLAAVRSVHAAIAKGGESVERTGALVRGYALLGLLSEFHWHPAHKAFKARSLLYAQRLVARDPKDPRGLRYRAYAEALAGLHQAALSDLNAAAQRSASVAPPGWITLIEALARCDAGALEASMANGPDAPLAALLRLTVVEYPPLSGVLIPAARQVLGLDRDCYRAWDAMCQVRGVSNLHEATALGLQALDEEFPARLKSLAAALPVTVRGELDKAEGATPALVAALRAAGNPASDAGEPSWSVLGHLVDETRFVQVYRRVYFMARVWNVPVDDEWPALAPTVADHRYRRFLDLFVLPPEQGTSSMAALAREADLNDFEFTQIDLARGFTQARSARVDASFEMASRHMDHVARDLAVAIRDADNARGKAAAPAFARLLLSVSPYSSYARATLIEKDAESVQGRLAEWEKGSADAPAVIGALAKRAIVLKHPEDAERLLGRYISLAPEAWAYEALAKLYKERGDRARWKSTLDAFLEAPDEKGLEHARIRVAIANDLMERRQWREAWPYADAAAQTWAAWAMRSAQRCAEGMGDLDTTELWYRREAERYEHSWGVWFMFCKRTGHGDVEAARTFAEGVIQPLRDRPDLSRPDIVQSDWLGFYYWLTGRPEQALAPLGRAYDLKADAPSCVYPLLAADMIGNTSSRAEWLKKFKTEYGTKAPKSLQVLELLFPEAAPGGAPPSDLKAIDAVLESINPETRGNTSFAVGVALASHDRRDLARKYLRMCGEGAKTVPWTRVVAADLLRQFERKDESKK